MCVGSAGMWELSWDAVDAWGDSCVRELTGLASCDTLSLATLRDRVQEGDLSFLTWGETDVDLLATLPQISLDDVQWSAFGHGLAVDCYMREGTTAMVKRPNGRLGGVAAGRAGKAWPLKVFSE